MAVKTQGKGKQAPAGESRPWCQEGTGQASHLRSILVGRQSPAAPNPPLLEVAWLARHGTVQHGWLPCQAHSSSSSHAQGPPGPTRTVGFPSPPAQRHQSHRTQARSGARSPLMTCSTYLIITKEQVREKGGIFLYYQNHIKLQLVLPGVKEPTEIKYWL